MKKYIDGRRYDTDVDKHLASFEVGNMGDFQHLYEGLYIKKGGEYFLHGVGGQGTAYGNKYDKTARGGEKIVPLSLEKAQEWVDANANDDYEDIFGGRP